jgi:uncharacterized protein (DUF1501 family)
MRRREFLLASAGAAGAYAVTAGLGQRAHADQPALRSPKRLITLFVTGGWDSSYALDPRDPAHASVPAGAVQQFAGLDIFTDPSRPNVAAFFDKYAGATALVRGVTLDAINHDECQRRIATGTREETQPDVAAIVAHDVANDLPLPYLVLGDTAWTGAYAVSSGRVGMTNQIVELLDPGSPQAWPAMANTSPGATGDPGLSTTERTLLRDYANASAARAYATRGSAGYNRARISDFTEAMDRAERLRALRSGFGTRGDALAYQSQIPLAIEALYTDIANSVMISTELAWDTHAENYLQNAFHDQLFAGLTQLVDGLIAQPGRAAGTTMLDDTVVVVFSEMSRTLYLNGYTMDAGKDHWPVTPALVIGAGVRGGQVFGGVDLDGASINVDYATGAIDAANGTPLLYGNFIAGVLALCGVDPSVHLPSVPAFDAFAV